MIDNTPLQIIFFSKVTIIIIAFHFILFLIEIKIIKILTSRSLKH